MSSRNAPRLTLEAVCCALLVATGCGGTEGDHIQTSVDLIWSGQVPMADLVGDVFPLEEVGQALDLLDRKVPGRDAIRVGLKLS